MIHWVHMAHSYLPIVLTFGFALAFATLFLSLSRFLGPRHPNATKLSVYECGLNPVGSARERFSVKFFLVAMIFIIFDIEVVFMYPWAVRYKEAIATGLGMDYFSEMVIFFVMLNLGLYYAWRKKALDWT